MAKDILDLKSEEDLKEYLDEKHIEVSEAFQSVEDDITNIKYEHDKDVFAVKTIEDLKGMDLYSIFYYIQAIQALALEVDNEAGKRLGHTVHRIESRLYDIPVVWEAMTIKRHWRILNEHFEENPSLKEEWDILCMGIKLTEE